MEQSGSDRITIPQRIFVFLFCIVMVWLMVWLQMEIPDPTYYLANYLNAGLMVIKGVVFLLIIIGIGGACAALLAGWSDESTDQDQKS